MCVGHLCGTIESDPMSQGLQKAREKTLFFLSPCPTLENLEVEMLVYRENYSKNSYNNLISFDL